MRRPQRFAGSLRATGGFSLTEMLVVLGIMGFVLAGAYTLGLVMNKAAEASEVQAAFTREVGTPLQLAEKYLQQNSALEEWEDYRVAFFTDTDLDGLSERVIIQAHSDGRLTFQVWRTDIQRENTHQIIDFTMSEHNTNVSSSEPLFVYLDHSGLEVGSLDGRPSDTRSVIMQVCALFQDRELSDERLVHFRNRM